LGFGDFFQKVPKRSPRTTMSKIGFVSLGCPKNLCDTEVMLRRLMDAGYEITPEETLADVVIINTCAFIESAKNEAIDNILDIAWLKENHHLKGIIVTGCLAERYREQIAEEMPEVDAVVGIGSQAKIVDAVKHILDGAANTYTSFDDMETAPLGGDRLVTTGELAYLKIAEGCDNRCTYCAIPLIRGKMRSRTVEDIIAEAKELDSLGVKELCVVAQDTTAYGIDLYGEYKLPELLEKLVAETSIPWIRLLYLYPDKITPELLEVIRDNDRILSYFDIPIQHVSENVLRRMARRGGSAAVRNAVKMIREMIPDATIRTTAIVGFPGETEEDFCELCEFVAETKFDRFGAFTYSREEDTPAYDFDDQIDEDVKQERYDILMRTQVDISAAKLEEMIGKTVEVFCEGFDPVAETHYGRSRADAPEIDGKVYFWSDRKIPEGEIIEVKITESMDFDLMGEATEKHMKR